MAHEDLINALFDEAHALPPEQREAHLRSRCADEGVVSRVLALLASSEAAPTALTEPAWLESGAERAPTIHGFHVLRKIAEGGMGVVYEAEEVGLEGRRKVALKVIRPELVASGEARARFRREAATAARLDHPAIVPVYRYSESVGPQYLVMKYVEGATFHEWARGLETRRDAGEIDEAQRLREIARGVQRVAEGLHHAHGLQVVHRDVKPSNILVDRDGQAYLTDFGIAKATDEPALSTPAQNPLTVDYASPEQVRRDAAAAEAQAAQAEIDGRSDVFSLGVILYEALTGSHPFRGANAEQTRDAICTTEPPSPRRRRRTIPRRLAAIVRIAIEKDRRFRYPTAAHLATDLARWLRGEPIFGREIGPARRLHRWAHRNRTAALATCAAALTVGAAGLAWIALEQRRASTGLALVRAVDASGRAVRAAVTASPVDPATLEIGAPVRLGTTPLRARLRPGAYRLTAWEAGGRSFGEGAVVVARGGERREAALGMRAANEAAPAGMVRFEGGAFDFGSPDRRGLQRQRRVVVAPFYLDEAEVSNAEYEAFLAATGRAEPMHWAEWRAERPGVAHRFDPALADRPVVGVSWEDAAAYASWRGKRLPTVFEWEFAMRAGGARTQPWGEGEPEGLQRPTMEDALRAGVSDRAFQRSAYERYTRPVRESGPLRSPEGLHHGSSNVQEMMESVSVGATTALVVKGAGWHQLPQVTTPVETMTLPFESVLSDGTRVPSASMKVGFRCARSVAPSR